MIDNLDKFAPQCENERRLLADCLAQGAELGKVFHRRSRLQLFQSAAYCEEDSSPEEALARLTGQAGG